MRFFKLPIEERSLEQDAVIENRVANPAEVASRQQAFENIAWALKAKRAIDVNISAEV